MASCAALPTHPVTPEGVELLPLLDHRALELSTRPEEVARGRRWATAEAARLGASEDAVATIELLTSEVLTNAVRHGDVQGRVRMVVARVGSLIRLAVSDAGNALPTRRSPAPESLGGRGLQILDLLAATWGTQVYATGGKCVWLTIDLSGTASVRAA